MRRFSRDIAVYLHLIAVALTDTDRGAVPDRTVATVHPDHDAIRRSCTFVPAPILKVEPINTLTCPPHLGEQVFFFASVSASWIKAISNSVSPPYEFSDVIIHIELTVMMRRGKVAEYKLCRLRSAVRFQISTTLQTHG